MLLLMSKCSYLLLMLTSKSSGAIAHFYSYGPMDFVGFVGEISTVQLLKKENLQYTVFTFTVYSTVPIFRHEASSRR